MTPASNPPAALTGISERDHAWVSCVLRRSSLCHSPALAFSLCYPLFVKVFNRHSLRDICVCSDPCGNAVVDAQGTTFGGQDAAPPWTYHS